MSTKKVILITGGSRGIGAATARLAAAAGYAVCISYISNRAAADAVVASITVDYAASKAAIDTLTIGLAKEVAAEGIRVNAVSPGVIYTEIHASGGEPQRVDRVKESIPMKRGGYPEEVARAVLWLLSEEASYTTGALIDVAGGR